MRKKQSRKKLPVPGFIVPFSPRRKKINLRIFPSWCVFLHSCHATLVLDCHPFVDHVCHNRILILNRTQGPQQEAHGTVIVGFASGPIGVPCGTHTTSLQEWTLHQVHVGNGPCIDDGGPGAFHV